ncbi:MAG: SpoIIE family protein phosphatase [Candidatus Poribacteria bacterium]|nr:SpoIIE family protein phosphatase [Candidatus Poribacteria bacterium]
MADLPDSIQLAFDDVERLADELRLAQELQQSMIPKMPPMLDQFDIAATWLPANEMSGDFYDFVPIDQDRWGIVLGDVMGKGMPAAMVMALMRSVLRMVSKTSSSPRPVLDALNQQLLVDVTPRRPVSLIYAVLDSYQRTLTVVNAGIPYPLMLTSSGKCEEIEIGGYPLGSTKRGFDYVDRVIDLHPNSAIVLYSDGIDEAQNDAGETYGFSRLPRIIEGNADLAAKALADFILQDVLSYTGHARHDDMTLVVIKAKEAIAETYQQSNRAYQLVPECLRSKIRGEQGKIEGEHSVVTLLTVDFTQSLMVEDFAESQSQSTPKPEHARPDADKIKHAIDTTAQIIFNYEGLVNRTLSTEISGFFGAPIRHPNDAEQAIHAAIEIRDTLHSMGEQQGNPFEVQIALHTGTVVVSDISDEAVEYSQVEPRFDTVRTLIAKAEPGEIWIDANTYRFTRAHFDYSLLPPIEVERGKYSLQPYRLVGQRTHQRVRHSGDTFLHHETQLERLQDYGDALVEEGVGRIISLVGGAGIGKNRLMAQFKESLGARVVWVTSRCAPEKQRSSYAVFVPIIQGILDIDISASGPDRSAQMRAALERLYNDAAIDWVFSIDEMQAYLESLLFVDQQLHEQTTFLSYEQLQRQTFVAIQDLLVAAAHHQPLVLALDDLRWIDDVSKNLITFILDIFLDTPIILLCLSHSQDWWLRDCAMKAALSRYESIILKWMSLEESAQFLDYLTPGKGIPEELKTLILHRGNGNPFHLTQIVKLLIASQILVQQDDEWIVTVDGSSIAFPNTLEGVLRARIDRLNVNAREIMQYAAVLGVISDLELLRQMADFIPHLDYHLENLQNLGLIQRQPGEDESFYRLERALIANIVYASIPTQERMTHHDWIAQTLEEQTSGRRAEHNELLAFHFSRGRKVSKAIEYLVKTGHRARRYFNNTDAIAFYEQALDLLRDVGPEAEKELWKIYEGFGHIFQVIGRHSNALASYNKLLDLSAGTDAAARFSQADIKQRIGEVYIHQSAWNDALESLKSAQRLLEGAEAVTDAHGSEGSVDTTERTEQASSQRARQASPPERARQASPLLGEIYHHLGYVYSQQGDLTQAIDAGHQALRSLPESAAPNFLARVHGRLGSYYTKIGDLKSAERHLQASIEHAERIGNRYLLSIFYNDLGVITRASHHLDQAIECYQKSIRIKKQLKYLDTLSRSYLSLALVCREIEDLENARIHLHNALKYTVHGSSDKFVGDVHVYLAQVYQQQGELDLAIEHYQKVIDIRMQANDTVAAAIGQEYLCQAYLASGDLETAMQVCTASLETAEMLDLDTLVVRNYMNLAQIYHAQRDWEAAIENLEIALVVAAKTQDERLMTQIHLFLAEVYLKGQLASPAEAAHLARTHFYEAIEMLEQINADEADVEEIYQIMEGHGLV